jgi:hypothetical protein
LPYRRAYADGLETRELPARLFPNDLDPAYARGRWTDATPLDEAFNRRLRALEDRLDPSVGKVAHRTSESFGGGFARARVSEEDSLNPPAHEDARADVA